MALNLGDVFVKFRVDTSGVDDFKKNLPKINKQTRKSKEAFKDAAKSSGSFNSALERAGKVASFTEGPLSGVASRLITLKGLLSSGSIAAVGFTAAIGALIKTSASAAQTFLKTEDSIVKLANAIAASGRNAQTSIKQLDTAAESLARRTLLGLDEARQVLSQAAAFQNIPTDQLERFSNVAADVAAALGRDVKGSVTQLAKALEAPASALDGLGRAGVFFNKTQREVLQNLVNTGQQAKATDIILSTLESRFKGFGTARGASGALDSLEVSIQRFRENIFLTTGAADALQGVFEKLTEVVNKFNEQGGLAERTGVLIAKALRGVTKAIDFLQNNIESIKKAFEVFVGVTILNTIKSIGLLNIRVGSLVSIFKTVKTLLGKAIPVALVNGLLNLAEKLDTANTNASTLVKTFVLVKSFFKTLANNFGPILKPMGQAFVDLENTVKNFFNNLDSSDIYKTLNNFSVAVLGSFLGLGKSIGSVLGEATLRVRNFINDVIAGKDILAALLRGDRKLAEEINAAANRARLTETAFSEVFSNAFQEGLKAAEIGNLTKPLEKIIDSTLGEGTFAKIAPKVQSFFSDLKAEYQKGLKSLEVGEGDPAPLLPDAFTQPAAVRAGQERIDTYFEELKKSVLGTAENFGKSVSQALGDSIVGKNSFDFKELSQNFVSRLFSALINELLINPLVKDFQNIMRSILETPAGRKGSSFAQGLNALGLIGSFFGGATSAASATAAGPVAAGSQSIAATTDVFGQSSGGQSVVLPKSRFFAKGGSPMPNKVSVVGENGPELFIPKQRGAVIPNDQLGMGGTTINMTVVAQDAQSFKNSRNKIKSDLRSFVN